MNIIFCQLTEIPKTYEIFSKTINTLLFLYSSAYHIDKLCLYE